MSLGMIFRKNNRLCRVILKYVMLTNLKGRLFEERRKGSMQQKHRLMEQAGEQMLEK